MASDRAGERIAVVVKGYPRLSETFIAQEILALEERGIPLEIWSLRHPTERQVHPIHQCIGSTVRYLTANRGRRLGQALVFARELSPEARHVHVHYLHTPASVVRYAAILTGRTWSFSAHAKDIWTTPDWELREKMGEAKWGVTCTRQGAARLGSLAPSRDHVTLVYHG